MRKKFHANSDFFDVKHEISNLNLLRIYLFCLVDCLFPWNFAFCTTLIAFNSSCLEFNALLTCYKIVPLFHPITT